MFWFMSYELGHGVDPHTNRAYVPRAQNAKQCLIGVGVDTKNMVVTILEQPFKLK